MVPANNVLKAGKSQANNVLEAGMVPASNVLKAVKSPANNNHFIIWNYKMVFVEKLLKSKMSENINCDILV